MFETVDRMMVVMNDDDLADDCRDGVTNRSVRLWVAGNSSWRYAVDAVALCWYCFRSAATKNCPSLAGGAHRRRRRRHQDRRCRTPFGCMDRLNWAIAVDVAAAGCSHCGSYSAHRRLVAAHCCYIPRPDSFWTPELTASAPTAVAVGAVRHSGGCW